MIINRKRKLRHDTHVVRGSRDTCTSTALVLMTAVGVSFNEKRRSRYINRVLLACSMD